MATCILCIHPELWSFWHCCDYYWLLIAYIAIKIYKPQQNTIVLKSKVYLFNYKVFHGFYVKPTSTNSLMIYLPKVIILAQAWRLVKYPTSSIVHHCQQLTLFNQSCIYTILWEYYIYIYIPQYSIILKLQRVTKIPFYVLWSIIQLSVK